MRTTRRFSRVWVLAIALGLLVLASALFVGMAGGLASPIVHAVPSHLPPPTTDICPGSLPSGC